MNELFVKSKATQNYGGACSSSSQCTTLSSYGLICNNNNCTCSSTGYYDGTTCRKLKLIFK